MKERLTTFTQSVKDWWSKTSKKMRIVILSATAAILAVSLIVVILLNHTDYVVLYDGLTPAENAEVIAQLQEMGVEGVLQGTRLLIPSESENTVRMQLAYKGYNDSGFDYTIFEKGSSLTATQADKQQWTIFQLQERLQSTIKTFPEVLQAVVTISLPEKDAFVLEQEVVNPTASVKLQTRPGRELTAEQIQGILNIVKNSVPGLAEENIAISDQSGDLLGIMALGRDAMATKLTLTEQVNETVKRRILAMLNPLYGEGRVNVAVNSVLDTNKMVTERNSYEPLDPENPTRNPLDYVEYAREKTGQDGFAEGVPGANDNTDVPEYLAEQQEIDAADYYSLHDVYDYLVGSTKSQIIKEGLDITDMTVAVIIDADSLPEGQLEQIRNLVAATSGIKGDENYAIADKITVHNIKFNTPITPESITSDPRLQRVLILSGIALLALIIIFTIIIILMRRKRQQQAAEEEAYQESTLLDLMNHQEDSFEPIVLPETNEQKLKSQIKDLAATDPEIVAQLIKTWLMK